MGKTIGTIRLARRLGVHPASIRRAANSGRLPHYRLEDSGKMLFDLEEVRIALRKPRAAGEPVPA